MQHCIDSLPEIQGAWPPVSPCKFWSACLPRYSCALLSEDLSTSLISGLLWLTFFFSFHNQFLGINQWDSQKRMCMEESPWSSLWPPAVLWLQICQALKAHQRAPWETAAGLLGGRDTIIKKLRWLASCLTLGNPEFQEVRGCRACWGACVAGLRWHRRGGVQSSPAENYPAVLSQGLWHLG